jgi:paraquat-inducible protein A
VNDINPITHRFPRQVRQLQLLIALASLSLVVGLVAPIITLEKFVLIENTFSVLSGVGQLLQEGRWFLFMIISIFSILLPVLKLYVLHRLLGKRCHNAERLRTYLHWMHLYGKWSMLDVFIVAVLVVAVKLGAIAQVEMRYGLYAFAASVLLTMVVTARVVALADRVERWSDDQD